MIGSMGGTFSKELDIRTPDEVHPRAREFLPQARTRFGKRVSVILHFERKYNIGGKPPKQSRKLRATRTLSV
jgi:hypothetical protein